MADTTGLDDAVAETLRLLPQLAELIAEPDNDGTPGRGGAFATAPPWNSAVANILLDIHEGARRLEAELYLELTGMERTHRGGSDTCTELALREITQLGAQLGLNRSHTAAFLVERWASAARRLPSVDEEPVWRRLSPGPGTCVCGWQGRTQFALEEHIAERLAAGDLAQHRPRTLPPDCPYCGTFSLRVAVRSRVLRCFFPDCRDRAGRRPAATLELGRVSGEPLLVWQDGTVQIPPPPDPAG